MQLCIAIVYFSCEVCLLLFFYFSYVVIRILSTSYVWDKVGASNPIYFSATSSVCTYFPILCMNYPPYSLNIR